MIFVSLRNTSNFSRTSRQIECFICPWYIFNVGNSPGTTFRKGKSLQKAYYCRDETNILSVASKRFFPRFWLLLTKSNPKLPSCSPSRDFNWSSHIPKGWKWFSRTVSRWIRVLDEEPGVKLKAKETEIHCWSIILDEGGPGAPNQKNLEIFNGFP